MIKLSVVIITYNEEKCIAKCIESIQDIADEILVVDSFSTDKTKEICQSFGARFIVNKFEGHVQQKNYAASQARYDIILSLDADEVVSEQLNNSIKSVKNNFSADGYSFNRLNNYCGKWIKHSGWYPDTKLRLWDRRKGKWGGENPHDKYEMNDGCNTKKLKGDLLHYSYSTVQEHLNQVQKFTDIAASASFYGSKKAPILKIIFYPIWKFIRDYIINLGFLDGYYGFVICSISAHATFLKYVKIRELIKNQGVIK